MIEQRFFRLRKATIVEKYGRAEIIVLGLRKIS